MTLSRKISLLVALVGLGAIVGFWLSRPQGTATWLTVEVPQTATVGQSMVVRVITNSITPAVVTVDLHWSTTRRESRGVLSGSPAQRAGPPGSTLTSRLDVPAREEMGYVRAVIYAGQTAGWGKHIVAATSDYIPVVTAMPGTPSDSGGREITMFEQRPDPAAARLDSVVVQTIIAGLWATGAVMWRRRGRVLALAGLAAAVWEILPVEVVVGDAARVWATNHRWYADRLGIQLFVTITVLTLTAAAVVAIWVRQREAAPRAAWLGLGIYAGVSLASLISLHKVDALLARQVMTLSTLQSVQLAAAVLAVGGSGLAWRRTRPVH